MDKADASSDSENSQKVEDDPPWVYLLLWRTEFAETLAREVERSGCRPVLSTARRIFEQLEQHRASAIVIDLDSVDCAPNLVAELRTKQSRAAILALSAQDDENFQVSCFCAGVDDFISKPFSLAVFSHRFKAMLASYDDRVLRDERSEEEVIEHRGLTLDQRRHRVFVNGEELKCTPTEYRILQCLLRERTRPVNRQELIDHAALGALVTERTIDVHVRGLRKKLGSLSNLIKTVRGIGYKASN